MKKIAIFTLILFAKNIYSQNLKNNITDSLSNQIEKYVEGISPGVAVGIVKNGETIFTKYVGYSNLEHQIKINKNTRFKCQTVYRIVRIKIS